jgi:hypothetical protein
MSAIYKVTDGRVDPTMFLFDYWCVFKKMEAAGSNNLRELKQWVSFMCNEHKEPGATIHFRETGEEIFYKPRIKKIGN